MVIARNRMPSEASAKEGLCITSILSRVFLLARERYVGITSNLEQRLREHNAGKSSHTSKFKPWKLTAYIAFTDRAKAETFEHHLKSGSGHAFARKRLW